MSIHEVQYDSKGHVIAARCVDKAIDDHRKNPQPDNSGKGVHVYHIHRSPAIDEITLTEGGYAGLPAKFHTLTAVNRSTVIESFSELQFARSVKTAPAIIHRREDVANARANVRGHEYGFVWTEPGESVDVYVAPKGPLARLKTALGR